ncbi:MAG: hypothetical protein QS748_11220 [Candidatus Endonucleobacter bathymodioli]|uniref:N-acetyltransferase domain-containing protein n=1 Tax=Candidatus Endonucleibacter bathymodioli TaxID=539814 RepID=A0AA90P0C1_9GAMM|nr:hypothetical protein [Candidatus Endonucleobacter bathymodioli]
MNILCANDSVPYYNNWKSLSSTGTGGVFKKEVEILSDSEVAKKIKYYFNHDAVGTLSCGDKKKNDFDSVTETSDIHKVGITKYEKWPNEFQDNMPEMKYRHPCWLLARNCKENIKIHNKKLDAFLSVSISPNMTGDKLNIIITKGSDKVAESMLSTTNVMQVLVVNKIYVGLKYRRSCIGTTILNVIKGIATANSIKEIYIPRIETFGSDLETLSHIRLFYEKNGFHVYYFSKMWIGDLMLD